MLHGQDLGKEGMREEALLSAHKRITELEEDLREAETANDNLKDEVLKAEGKNLELKFEKENFDLQYARLQKRITDLEAYKLKSS